MKFEQEDLLEKFIQNAKRSRLWALLGAAAFVIGSITVVYVAKEIKGNTDTKIVYVDSSGNKKVDTPKTVFVNVPTDDPKLKDDLIKLNQDLVKTKLQRDDANNAYKDEKERADDLADDNKRCEDKTDSLIKAVEKIKIKLEECLNQPDKTKPYRDTIKTLRKDLTVCLNKQCPPVPKYYNIRVFYYGKTDPGVVLKFINLITKKYWTVTPQAGNGGMSAEIVYYNNEDAADAGFILNKIKNKNDFNNQKTYTVKKNSSVKKELGSIDVYLFGTSFPFKID